MISQEEGYLARCLFAEKRKPLVHAWDKAGRRGRGGDDDMPDPPFCAWVNSHYLFASGLLR